MYIRAPGRAGFLFQTGQDFYFKLKNPSRPAGFFGLPRKKNPAGPAGPAGRAPPDPGRIFIWAGAKKESCRAPRPASRTWPGPGRIFRVPDAKNPARLKGPLRSGRPGQRGFCLCGRLRPRKILPGPRPRRRRPPKILPGPGLGGVNKHYELTIVRLTICRANDC